MTAEVRVRFAPSPTGYLHIGGARTALFNWFFARKMGGTFILRIEDTDRARLKEDSVSQILRSMKWLGIDWDEGPEVGGAYGPYTQTERLELYRAEALRLVEEGKAYYCDNELEADETDAADAEGKAETEKKLETKIENKAEKQTETASVGAGRAIRLKIPREGISVVDDMIRGKVEFDLSLMEDLVIMKSNGLPTYNFACVVDDHAMKLTHIIRAEEHLPNTPKQLLVYEALGYEPPRFAHISMILAPDRSKLSKRHGATSVEEFRDDGFMAPAIVNYLTLLGWSPEGEQEILTPEETVKQFELTKVAKKAAIYDTQKLTWMNSQYMVNLPAEEVAAAWMPFLQARGWAPDGALTPELIRLADLLRSRAKTLKELTDSASYFFEEPQSYDEKGVKKFFAKEGASERLKLFAGEAEKLPEFTEVSLEELYTRLAEEQGLSVGQVLQPMRLALTGRTISPGMYETMAALGRTRCVERLRRAAEYAEKCR